MKKTRLHRQCPYCKSKKGFRMEYMIKGYGHEIINFKGKVMDAERETVDYIDHAVICLSCDKHMDSDKVQIQNPTNT